MNGNMCKTSFIPEQSAAWLPAIAVLWGDRPSSVFCGCLNGIANTSVLGRGDRSVGRCCYIANAGMA